MANLTRVISAAIGEQHGKLVPELHLRPQSSSLSQAAIGAILADTVVEMHLARLYIDGFKRLVGFDLQLNNSLTVIVGDNETGKTSLLEAIALVLTRQYDGRSLDYSIDPYMFNAARTAEYFTKLRNGGHCAPPQILIEAYFTDKATDPALAKLKGRNNSKNEDCPGLRLLIEPDADHIDALTNYARDDSNPVVIPVEFYKVHWHSFAGTGVTLRALPFRAKTIDTSLPRMVRGPHRYVSQLVDNVLTDAQRRELSLAYKKLRHSFAKESGVAAINDHLKGKDNGISKVLTVQVDMSSRASWDSTITAHLDDLPYDCAGKGALCRIQMRLAVADSEKSQILLIEEPENHLSHSNLCALMEDIHRDCEGRQVIVTTHSAFVLNKLGIDNLRLISRSGGVAMLADLTADTRDYFMKMPGYNTLRLILAQKCLLVEGPSDELIVQRAYKDKHGKLPLDDGIDVISVGGLAFKRFLEIAVPLQLKVVVVIDNDGDVDSVKEEYKDFIGGHSSVRVCFDEDTTCKTLEPQLLKANSLTTLNALLETKHKDTATLLKFMKRKKAECALRLFETTEKWNVPKYIADAID